MSKAPFSIEAVMLGRNDEYEPNWNEKLYASIAYNRTRFDGSGIDYRVTFVEWNPPPERPLLSPGLLEKFPFLRAIVVGPEVHRSLCESDQGIMLNFSLNCGLRTSSADFCLISAGDLFVGRQLASYISELGLSKSCLYRAERVNIRPDINFALATPADIESPSNTVSVDTCTEPPYDVPPYTHACGDFLLVDRQSMLGIRGFDEGIRFARLHLDSRFCSTVMSAGLHVNLIGRIFHISHTQSFVNQQNNYRDAPYDYRADLPYINPRSWGLADHHWTELAPRLWKVEPPAPGGLTSYPFAVAAHDREAVNKVTQRLIEARESQAPSRADQRATVVAVLPIKQMNAQPHWQGARVTSSNPVVVETATSQWGYSAILALPSRPLRAKAGEFLLIEVDAEALAGSAGLSLVRGGNLQSESILTSSMGRSRIYIPATATEEALMIRNAQPGGTSSLMKVYSARLLSQPKVTMDSQSLLLN